MSELLLILGIGLALDFLLSRIIPKRPRPTVRVEESPSGTILVSPDLLTESDIDQLRRDWENQYRGLRNASNLVMLERGCVTINEAKAMIRSPIADTESRGLHQ